MKQSCRAALISLLCLLSLATPARAAWVVWMTFVNYDTTDKPTTTGTSPVTGAESKAECLVLLKDVIRDKTAGVEAQTLTGHVADHYNVVIKGDNGSKATYTLRCLPDTVDPREPKAK